jgi:hypothetical protein
MATSKPIPGNQHAFKEHHKNDHFTDVDRAGMTYFMPKLLKSSSCPNYIQEAEKKPLRVAIPKGSNEYEDATPNIKQMQD